jgi:hypothetical protein
MKLKIFGLLCAMFLFGGMAEAQSVTEYRLSIYLQGGTTPVTTATLPASAFVCGQPVTPPQTGTVTNPTLVLIADPAAPSTADCRYVDPGTGPLLALPFNPTAVYEATIVAVNANGPSATTARSNPFSRPGTVPNVPGRLRIGKSE